MAVPLRNCLDCGAKLPVQQGRHQPRKYCTTCRPPRNRGVTTTEARVTTLRPDLPSPKVTLTSATERALRDAGRHEDPEGLAVLQLAHSIDEGGHSGASLASLSREFRAALAAALSTRSEQATDESLSWDVG